MSVDLGALVASPHFRLVEGMPMRGRAMKRCTAMVMAVTKTHVLLAETGDIVWAERPDMNWHLIKSSHDGAVFDYFEPDPDHWRFAGCLLHLVREAWGDPCIHVAGDGITWCVENGNLDSITTEFIETEAEALTAALLAAPPKCPGCRGRGEYTEYVRFDGPYGVPEDVPCPDCGGTGLAAPPKVPS